MEREISHGQSQTVQTAPTTVLRRSEDVRRSAVKHSAVESGALPAFQGQEAKNITAEREEKRGPVLISTVPVPC